MTNEREILRLEAEKLESDGYTVVLEPSPSALPDGLRGLRPDAIAIGKEPNLLLEVVSGDQRSEAKVQQLHKALELISKWKLHIIYAGAKAADQLIPIPLQEIKNSADRIPSVAAQDTRASLMLCWATLEALARALQPGTFPRPQTPGRIIERLAGVAYVTASTAEFLRRMATKRNEFVHGQLRTEVDRQDIDKFVGVLQSLIKEAQAENVR